MLHERFALRRYRNHEPSISTDFKTGTFSLSDPFAGSNALGMVAEKLGGRWVAIEMEEDYLRASKVQFDDLD